MNNLGIALIVIVLYICGQGSEFLRGFRSAAQGELAAAWDEIQGPLGRESQTLIPQLDHVYDRAAITQPQQPILDGNFGAY